MQQPSGFFNFTHCILRCSWKFNVISRCIPRYFLKARLSEIVIKIYWMMIWILTFSGKYIFLSFFAYSWLKLIFHYIIQSLILLRSLFRWFADVLVLLTTKLREALSKSNLLLLLFKSSKRSLIQIKSKHQLLRYSCFSTGPWREFCI